MKKYSKGWFQVAFELEIPEGLSAVSIGNQRLILLRVGEKLRAFAGDCPHRGASLACGGRLLHDDSIICPFHGYRIGLGKINKNLFSVQEYPLLSFGGMVFVQISSDPYDKGWPQYAERFVAENVFINGFELRIQAPMETVIENAFDQHHFFAVHGIPTDHFEVHHGEFGELIVKSTFYLPTIASESNNKEAAATQYRAIVISPGLSAVELKGTSNYMVITGATDIGNGECIIRLTLAFPKSQFGDAVPAEVYEPLLKHSRRGLEQDQVIWESLTSSIIPDWTLDDASVLTFFKFCETFQYDHYQNI